MKSVHTEYSSLLLVLLFIFLKVRDRECQRHEEQKLGPAPDHRKKQAKFTVPDSSTLRAWSGRSPQPEVAGWTPFLSRSLCRLQPPPVRQGVRDPKASQPAGTGEGLRQDHLTALVLVPGQHLLG